MEAVGVILAESRSKGKRDCEWSLLKLKSHAGISRAGQIKGEEGVAEA